MFLRNTGNVFSVTDICGSVLRGYYIALNWLCQGTMSIPIKWWGIFYVRSHNNISHTRIRLFLLMNDNNFLTFMRACSRLLKCIEYFLKRQYRFSCTRPIRTLEENITKYLHIFIYIFVNFLKVHKTRSYL